jgi:hypothetical protein
MVWVVSLFTTDVITRRVSPVITLGVFGVCIGSVSLYDPITETVLYPPKLLTQGATSIAFEENQLSPGLISLSLRSTTHPLPLQREWVRASSTCYRTFTLVMDRSPGFGSTGTDLTPY